MFFIFQHCLWGVRKLVLLDGGFVRVSTRGGWITVLGAHEQAEESGAGAGPRFSEPR